MAPSPKCYKMYFRLKLQGSVNALRNYWTCLCKSSEDFDFVGYWQQLLRSNRPLYNNHSFMCYSHVISFVLSNWKKLWTLKQKWLSCVVIFIVKQIFLAKTKWFAYSLHTKTNDKWHCLLSNSYNYLKLTNPLLPP